MSSTCVVRTINKLCVWRHSLDVIQSIRRLVYSTHVQSNNIKNSTIQLSSVILVVVIVHCPGIVSRVIVIIDHSRGWRMLHRSGRRIRILHGASLMVGHLGRCSIACCQWLAHLGVVRVSNICRRRHNCSAHGRRHMLLREDLVELLFINMNNLVISIAKRCQKGYPRCEFCPKFGFHFVQAGLLDATGSVGVQSHPLHDNVCVASESSLNCLRI